MTAELGHFALILGFIVAIVQMIVPMVGAHKGWSNWMNVAMPTAILQSILATGAFGALMYAFITSDFSLQVVVANSHSNKPLLYKITGTWANHEGSLLMWVSILTWFGLAVAVFGGGLRPELKARVLSVQAAIAVAFFAFLIFTSNPFERVVFPPMNGQGLNPLLQDAGLAFHPPFLYLGYVGLSMSFSFAVAALIEGRVDAAWARWVRPWTLAAWVFLTIGIALGSWWAYYELGWGGWWFWDPVENSSFMPWLIATALLHSAIVVEKRESLKSWTILLAILAFSFSLLGTFIVRSGVLTSVHAFASDPARGMFILGILVVTIGGSLTLYAARGSIMTSKGVFSTLSRESGLILNNLLLVVSAFVVLVGTVWPLFAELIFGRKLSVGAPFFDVAFTPFVIVIAMVLPVAALLPWKRANLKKATRPLWGALALSISIGLLVWVMQTGGRMMAPIGLALAAWTIFGVLIDLGTRIKFRKVPFVESLRRFRNLPRADLGKAAGHLGFGLMIFGISAITAWEAEDIRIAKVGDSFEITGAISTYEIRFDAVNSIQGKNYRATQGTFTVLQRGKEIATLYPQKRFYPVSGTPTTEAAMDIGITRDVYIVIGDPQEAGGFAIRSYVKPFVNWIWFGAMVMAFGGVLSLTDRRFRVGAGARKGKIKANAALPPATPAE